MSLDATRWAWEQPLKPTCKLVLLSLADRAGEITSECYPSVKRICTDTGMDRKTVIKSLKMLCDCGLISDTGDRKGDTKQIVVYQLNHPKNGIVPKTEQFLFSHDETVPFFPGKSTVFPCKESQKRDTGSTNESTNESTITLSAKKQQKAKAKTDEDFELFWNEYPKKRNKGDAEKAWKKIKPNKELQKKIIEAIGLAKQSPDWIKANGQYIPQPASWLNSKGWLDDYSLPNNMAAGQSLSSHSEGFSLSRRKVI